LKSEGTLRSWRVEAPGNATKNRGFPVTHRLLRRNLVRPPGAELATSWGFFSVRGDVEVARLLVPERSSKFRQVADRINTRLFGHICLANYRLLQNYDNGALGRGQLHQ